MAGVDGEHQLVRVIGRAGEDKPAVPRTQVDGDRAVRSGQIRQLADIHLGEAASG